MCRRTALEVLVAAAVSTTAICFAGWPERAAQAEELATYDLDELVFLNGLGGFGDAGRLETSRQIVSPNSAVGFSLKVVWEDHPGEPAWWSIRIGLPQRPVNFDAFQFDLYVEATDEKATVNFFLYETDDDRWVCWHRPLKELELRRWHHFVVPRGNMQMWYLGNSKAEWERVHGLAIEPSSGRAVFHVDGVRLVRSDTGRRMEVFTAADDGLHPDPTWGEAVRSPAEPGCVYFPFDEARLGFERLLETPVELRSLLGAVGTPISGYSGDLPAKARYLWGRNVPVVFYSSLASGYLRYLTRRQAWDVNAQGRSLNCLPCSFTGWDCQHAIALAHPAVTEALRHKVDALLKAGVGTWMVVDYVFPWWDTLWGYSPAMLSAYRKDLAGKDEGLHLRDGKDRRVIHFADYFRAYNGFFPQPSHLGLKDWNSFVPPKPGEGGDKVSRGQMALFMYLRSFEWLKLPDRVGRYMISRGGNRLWIVPNPEDTCGSSDYVLMVRSAGVGNLFPEWFGPIGWAAEAGYASLPYLREEANRGNSHLSIIQETGAGGHSAPYLDWRLSYDGVYALTAAGQFDDFDNDFIDEAPFEAMSDPGKNEYQFKRFRDGVAKALAFRQARAEKPKRPAVHILCISERPPTRACGSIFFGLGQPHTLAVGLSRAHVAFDLRDSFELERVLDRYRVVAYSPWSPRVGDFGRLRRWLEVELGRVLVTHSFVPTRDATGFWGMDRSAQLGNADGQAALGLGRLTSSQAMRCAITSVSNRWKPFLKDRQTYALIAPLTCCEKGETLVMSDAGPLVSRVKVGKGEVIYLHYTPSSSTEVQRLTTQVMEAVAQTAGLKPVCQADSDTLVQVFEVTGGYSVVAWDAPTMGKWDWRYEAGIPPMRYEAPGVDRTIRVAAKGQKSWLAYDFWGDRLESVQPEGDLVNLHLKGALTSLFYTGPDSSALRATVESARRVRYRMRELRFETVGM